MRPATLDRASQLYLGLILVFLYLPIAVMMAMAFNRSELYELPFTFDLKWFRALAENEKLLGASFNSLWIAALWLLIYLPAYSAAYGLTNFLFLCNLGVILTALGLWFPSRLLLSSQAVFFVTALLAIPTLMALARIREKEIDVAQSHGAVVREVPDEEATSVFHLLRQRPAYADRRAQHDEIGAVRLGLPDAFPHLLGRRLRRVPASAGTVANLTK